MIVALAVAAIALTGVMALAWLAQRRTGNSGWIDAIWSFGVGGATVLTLTLLPANGSRRVLLGALVAIWSARLGNHILSRTRRTPDDPRYAKLMKEWGAAAPLRLFLFLQLQAVAGLVLVGAAVLAASGPAAVLTPATLLFATLAIATVVGEAVADAQLAACKRDGPENAVCDRGLWACSRHPNYFFEWLFWLSISALALTPPTQAHAALALAAPAMMYVLLRYGSGVPHLEAHMRRTRPEAFAAYASRVPVFFPRIQF